MNRTILKIFTSIAALGLFAGWTQLNAEAITIQATLVAASDVDKPIDPSLKNYAKGLQNNFRYKHFRRAGGGSARAEVPGSASINTSGHSFKMETSAAGDDRVRINVSWIQGRKQVARAGLVVVKKSPGVLAGPTVGGERLILLLEYR